ncbi:hypothetical protein ACNC73_005463, partial [Escherichia coli]
KKKFRVPFTVSGWGCVRHLVAKTPSDAQTKLYRTSDDRRNGGKTLHVTAGEIIQRSPLPDSSGRKSWGPAPLAWVPILCLTTHGEKHWDWWLVSRSEANHLQDDFLGE